MLLRELKKRIIADLGPTMTKVSNTSCDAHHKGRIFLRSGSTLGKMGGLLQH